MSPWLSKLLIWLVCVAAFIGAPFLGSAVANGDFMFLSAFVAIILGLLYLCALYRYTWQIAMIISTLGFLYVPFGFKISPDNISIGLITALLLITWWRKGLVPTPLLRQNVFFIVTRILVVAVLVYGSVHFYLNMQNPPDPANYSWKNSSKTYLQFYGPFFLILYGMCFPKALPLGKNFYRTICLILLVSLIIGLSLRLYCLLLPGGRFTIGTGEGEAFFLPLPFLNLWENFHTLRWLSTFTVLMVSAILTAPGIRFSTGNKLLMLVLIILGFLAAFISGGRMAIILGLLLGVFMLFYRKKFKTLMFTAMLAVVILSLVNAFPKLIFNEQVPLMIRRSFSLLAIDPQSTNYDAQNSINSSSEWRKELFLLALKDWQSSSRNFWFGRDVYAYNEQDIISISVMGANDSILQSSLRRGATHTLLSDLLVTYGLCGCILYLATIAVVLAMLAHFYYRLPKTHYLEPLLLTTFIYYLLSIPVSVQYNNWLIVLSIVGLNQFYQSRESSPQTIPR